ncbi:unnamed protein product [Brachionus calyciflorus]|uniref:DDE Tnp4 domain-containing protein n=1 Tax=Brachionus calyciflorus TaxID=104777 RepID=A0A814FZ17_9BILA|nr:unnamed protein product [Brachionus calyciflorus]
MPAFIDTDKKQLTTEQANNSRLVTESRWVIEAVNGILKLSFKALSQVKNTMLNHIGFDYRITGALINRYFDRLSSDKEYGRQKIN